MLKNGYVTFGSFQQVSKMTPAVLAVWARVLNAVPHSRLRLQTKSLGKTSIRDKLSGELSQAGIDLARVELLDAADLDLYLEAHGKVDILLDTFPYPGGTTTAFALWMGVPTITLADDDTMLARQGAAMLGCVGLGDWVAANEAAYVDLAQTKSADVAGLTALRRNLRATAEASPLFDAKRFAQDLRAAFFAMSNRAETTR
jgi:predicted O-linked N-acetylglucosamine transferase (SPINDLY family)